MTGDDTDSRAGHGATPFRVLLACLVVAWLLASVMALRSAANAHPDEVFHLAAGEYYLDHWLPPHATEEALSPSLSPYGYTYLGDVDVSYFLAGKLARLLPGRAPYEHLRFRAFNLLLLGVLIAVYGARRDLFSPIVLLLLTPQTWYVFSYFNNDAFPLFIALLIAQMVFGPRAARIADAFSGPWRASSLRTLAGLGALLGLLVLTKSNYLPFLGFVAFVALWNAFGFTAAAIAVTVAGVQIAQSRGFFWLPEQLVVATISLGAAAVSLVAVAKLWRAPVVRTELLRAAVVAAAAILVAAPPLAYDRIANGNAYEKNSAMSVIAEKHAEPQYRPSQASAAESHFGLRLRDKGVPFSATLVHPWNWPTKTWKSFTGYYGYMTIRGPDAYYIASFVLHLLFAGYVSGAILRRGSPAEGQLLAVATAFGGGIIAISLYHSWVNDFQAQGRYLFPALVLASVPFTKASRLFEARIIVSLLGTLFGLSALSFVFVGLFRIAKTIVP